MTHALKTEEVFFKDIISGAKTFEVRKFDRPFKVGDTLLLQEYNAEKKTYTGEEWNGHIVYLLEDPAYVKKGFCILGIKEKE
jgi:hypothetical protein